MADEITLDESPRVKRKRRWAKRIGWVLAAVIAVIVIGAALVMSPIGKRVIADQIAQVAPASGLRFEVGRIEGDIYNTAVLHDVTVLDPKGAFLTIPVVELDWRPLAWLWSGLDIREVTARRGTLLRLPELLPGDPDAPILPDFDIRIDTFEIEDLTLARGVAGDQPQKVNFVGEVDIRSGRALVSANGQLGTEDRIALLLDAEPDGDKFDLDLDARTAADGVIASLTGIERGYRARITGDGSWSDWNGAALVQRITGDERSRVAAFKLRNNAGLYSIIGQLSPELDEGSLLERAVGEKLSLIAQGTLGESVFSGQIETASAGLALDAEGGIDLAANRFEDFAVIARLRDPNLLSPAFTFENTRADLLLDGLFRELTVEHDLQIGALVSGDTRLENLRQTGTAMGDAAGWRVPLSASVGRIETGNTILDPQLVDGQLRGILTVTGSEISGRELQLAFDDFNARVNLEGDVARGAYRLNGPAVARNLRLENIGTINGSARYDFKLTSTDPWRFGANFSANIANISNLTIANLAGSDIDVSGAFLTGEGLAVLVDDLKMESTNFQIAADTRIAGGQTLIAGNGRHVQYGAFDFEAELSESGPTAEFVLADPLPAAGLKNVRVAIAPSEDGFAIQTEGQSLLGPFDGALELLLPAEQSAQVSIEQLRVWRTDVTGNLVLGEDALSGDLRIAGGGLDGRVRLAPDSGGQRFDLDLTARNARFGGETPVALAQADIDLSGRLVGGTSRIEGQLTGAGLEYGPLFIGQFAARANVVNGKGDITASIAGRRSDRFALKLDADVQNDRVAVYTVGEYAGRKITMPRRAVFTRNADGGWDLARSQIGYAGGYAILDGSLGGQATRLNASLSAMPLSIADLAMTDLGVGGTISGRISYTQPSGQLPSGEVKLRINDLTRSGTLLSSRPIDALAVFDLTPRSLTGGVVLREDRETLGRIKGSITGLSASGDLISRLKQGNLDARLAYDGPAQSLWRLSGVETFDITGPIALRANLARTINNPLINGRLWSDNLRVRSALSGTDITSVSARGVFQGSELRLTRFAGNAPGGGKVSGSGTVDFAGLSALRGPSLDLKIAAQNANILNANGLSATLTGPMRVVSNGQGGTIAGRLRVNRASWRLGVAAEDYRLPVIKTREINLPAQSQPARARTSGVWRYLIDATAASRIDVDGMGLNSEWAADVLLRGTTSEPRIGGEARLVRGDYTFAGTRFQLTEGRIEFDENQPIDPRLDIEAETNTNGLFVTASITGNAQTPEVAFSSIPSLPDEEILARLLFGDSIASLSATDALQLGAAVASLRGGGGGLDPIGRLRNAIGLDQLRIVSADPALDRDTAVALGKNIGEKFYVEIVTDGRNYSATRVEYRITSWLALLASVSTIGRESVVAEVSKDY